MAGTNYTREFIRHMLDTLADERQVTKRLTPWELEFLASVRKQAVLGLSRDQCQKLEQIYAEKTD